MSTVRFLNQGPRRSVSNSSDDDFFWEVVTVIGSAALGAAVAIATRVLLGRTSWHPSSQNIALGAGGLLLGSAAVAAGRDGVGIGIATASLTLASTSWRGNPVPPLVIPAGAPPAPVYDAPWRAAPRPAGLPDAAASSVSGGLPAAAARALDEDGGKAPWVVPNTERPANPFTLATLALGRAAVTEADVERAFGMPFERVIAARGPLFDPDLSKLVFPQVRPAGAPGAKNAPTVAVPKVSVLGVGKPMAPSHDLAQAIDRSAYALSSTSTPLSSSSANRQQQQQQQQQARIQDFRDVRDPALILGRLSLTPAQWLALTCSQQSAALFARQAADRGVPYWARGLWEQWNVLNNAYALRGTDRAAGLFWWLRRGPYLTGDPSVLDPRQGVVGNCFYIASLAGAAWVRPDVIRAANSRGGDPAARRPGLVTFYAPGHASPDHAVYASEISPGRLLLGPAEEGFPTTCAGPFCRERDGAGAWGPAYEKAMAVWRSGQPDTPPMGAHTSYYVDEATHPALNIARGLGTSYVALWRGHGVTWRFITDHCELTALGDRKATAILIATSSGTPPGARIAPRHCYTVLGYRLVNGTLAQQQVVLRNPWGYYAPGDPRDNVGTWMGMRLGEDGVGVLNLEPFYNSFLNISGNWYNTRHDFDFGTDQRWTDFSR